jgi:hypothetical protein
VQQSRAESRATEDGTRPALFIGTRPGNDVWGAVLWCVGIIVVFGALAIVRFRHVITR